jgi:hypothetical protein
MVQDLPRYLFARAICSALSVLRTRSARRPNRRRRFLARGCADALAPQTGSDDPPLSPRPHRTPCAPRCRRAASDEWLERIKRLRKVRRGPPSHTRISGAVYHLTSRGNARQKIFFTDDDREHFLSTLWGVIVRYGWLSRLLFD